MGRPNLGQTINRAVEDFLPRLIPIEEVRWTRPPAERVS